MIANKENKNIEKENNFSKEVPHATKGQNTRSKPEIKAAFDKNGDLIIFNKTQNLSFKVELNNFQNIMPEEIQTKLGVTATEAAGILGKIQNIIAGELVKTANVTQRAESLKALTAANCATLLKNSAIKLKEIKHDNSVTGAVNQTMHWFKEHTGKVWFAYKDHPVRAVASTISFVFLATMAPAFFISKSIIVQTIALFGYAKFMSAKRYFSKGMDMYDHNIHWAEKSAGQSFVWKMGLDKKVSKLIETELNQELKENVDLKIIVEDPYSGISFDAQQKTLRLSYGMAPQDGIIFTDFLTKLKNKISQELMAAKAAEKKDKAKINELKFLEGQLISLRFATNKRNILSLAGNWKREWANRWFIEVDGSFALPESLQDSAGVILHEKTNGKYILQLNHWLTKQEFDILLENLKIGKSPAQLIEKVKIAYKILNKNSTSDYNKRNFLKERDLDEMDHALAEQTTTFGAPFYVPLNLLYVSVHQLINTGVRMVYLMNNDARHIFEATSEGMTGAARRVEARMHTLLSLFPMVKDKLSPNNQNLSENYYELFLQLADPMGRQVADCMILDEAVAEALPADGRQRQLLNILLLSLKLKLNEHGLNDLKYKGKKLVMTREEAGADKANKVCLEDTLLEEMAEYNKLDYSPELSARDIIDFTQVYIRKMNHQRQGLAIAKLINKLHLYKTLNDKEIKNLVNLLDQRYAISRKELDGLVREIIKNSQKIEDLTEVLLSENKELKYFNNLQSADLSINEFIDLMNYAKNAIFNDKNGRQPYQMEIDTDPDDSIYNDLNQKPEIYSLIRDKNSKDFKGKDFKGGIFEALRWEIEFEERKQYSLEKYNGEYIFPFRKDPKNGDFGFVTLEEGSPEDNALLLRVVEKYQKAIELYRDTFGNLQMIRDRILAESSRDKVFAGLTIFQKYQRIYEGYLDSYRVKLETTGLFTEDAIDEMIGTLKEGNMFQVATAQGTLFQANKLGRSLNKIKDSSLFTAGADESAEMVDYLSIIEEKKNEYLRLQEEIEPNENLENGIAELLRSAAFYGGSGYVGKYGSLSYQLVGEHLKKAMEKVVYPEKCQHDVTDNFHIPVRELIGERESDEQYLGGAENEENYSKLCIVFAKLNDGAGNNDYSEAYTNDSLKRMVNGFKIEGSQAERLQIINDKIDSLVKKLTMAEELKRDLIISLEYRFNIPHDVAVELIDYVFQKDFLRIKKEKAETTETTAEGETQDKTETVKNLFKNNFEFILDEKNIINFYEYYDTKEHHQTGKKFSGTLKDILGNYVIKVANNDEPILDNLRSEYQKDLKVLKDPSMFYFHRNIPTEAKAQKPQNHNFMYLGADPFENMQKVIKVLIKWYREQGGQAGNCSFELLWKNLKFEQMKDTVSVQMNKLPYNGVDYSFWDEIDKWALAMDQAAAKGQIDFMKINYDIVDRRRDNNILVHELFKAAAVQRLGQSQDYQEKGLVYKIMFAKKTFGELTNAGYAANLDKDNYLYDFCLQPILAIYKPGYGGLVDKQRVLEIFGNDQSWQKFFKAEEVNGQLVLQRDIAELLEKMPKGAKKVKFEKLLQEIMDITQINKDVVYIQGQQGLYYTQFNAIEQAATYDMVDAQYTMFLKEGAEGREHGQGCFHWHNRKEDRLFILSRTIVDIQPRAENRLAPKFTDNVVATGATLAVYALAALGFSSLLFGLGLLNPFVGLFTAFTVCALAYFSYTPLSDYFANRVRVWHEKRTLFIPARIIFRMEYTKERSSVEDYRLTTEVVKSLVFALQIPSMIGAAKAEGGWDVVAEVQFPRWNSAKIEQIVVEKLEALVFKKYMKQANLSFDVFKEYPEVYKENAENNKYPLMTLYMSKFSEIMILFAVLGVSVFAFAGSPLALFFGVTEAIVIFGLNALLEYYLIKRTLAKHHGKIGVDRKAEKISENRFLIINGILNGKLILQRFSRAMAFFISSEPVKYSFRRLADNLYFRNYLREGSEKGDTPRSAGIKRTPTIKKPDDRTSEYEVAFEVFGLFWERVRKYFPLIAFASTVSWIGVTLMINLTTMGLAQAIFSALVSSALIIFAFLSFWNVYYRFVRFINRTGMVGISTIDNFNAIKNSQGWNLKKNKKEGWEKYQKNYPNLYRLLTTKYVKPYADKYLGPLLNKIKKDKK